MKHLWLILFVTIIFSCEENNNDIEKPQENTYACIINSEGYCIFTGTPHQQGLDPGTENIIDREENYLFGLDEAVAALKTYEAEVK